MEEVKYLEIGNSEFPAAIELVFDLFKISILSQMSIIHGEGMVVSDN